MSAQFPRRQRLVDNDLADPAAASASPGWLPDDWRCVVAVRQQALADGCPAPVVLAATHERALDTIPLRGPARRHAVDVEPDLGTLF